MRDLKRLRERYTSHFVGGGHVPSVNGGSAAVNGSGMTLSEHEISEATMWQKLSETTKTLLEVAALFASAADNAQSPSPRKTPRESREQLPVRV